MRPDKELIYQELLVLRCQRGDKAAQSELVSTWERRLFYFIRHPGKGGLTAMPAPSFRDRLCELKSISQFSRVQGDYP